LAVETKGISCCFDQESEKMLKDFRKKGLDDTAAGIIDSIGKPRLMGATVLEIGCGFGALTMEFIRRGAGSAVGVDLSPKMIQLGQSLASESGLSKSVSFQLGDAAVAELAKSDIVVLDAVLCCYPDMKTLVDNSSSAAGRFYAISIPDDARLATKLLRLVLPLQSVVFRRGSIKFFIHPTGAIKERLEGRGFKLESKSKAGWIWSVCLFAAPGAA
jgi:magnesium-protoporphyrin O-methyltransferase